MLQLKFISQEHISALMKEIIQSSLRKALQKISISLLIYAPSLLFLD